MRISISIIAPVLALALGLGPSACAGDSPAPMIRKCTKDLYEYCATEHDCTSNNCVPFAEEGYLICTVSCSDSMPCPDLNGMQVSCVMGSCKPDEPVECEVVPQ